MVVNLSKEFITEKILAFFPEKKLARKTKAPLWQIVKAIIYRLKTGCQWRELPIQSFFDEVLICWQTVYYYFNSWSESGIWQKVWIQFLAHEKSCLDLSSIQLDGSHTPAKRGGEAVGYQGRKKSKTTNALFLTDKNGLPIAMSPPFAGNHNDLFEIESHFQKMLADLQLSDISPDGLFMNADAGFDSKKLRENCQKMGIIPNIDHNKRNRKKAYYQDIIDEELYKERFSVERTNAWIDAFKILLIRFERKADNWASLHYLAFILIFLKRKI